MRFGVQLGVDTPTDPGELSTLASGVESLPFDSLWVGDHLVMPRSVDDAAHERGVGGRTRFADRTGASTSEVFTTLAYLAAVTSRIRLGTAVLILPLRNPVLTAKMLTGVDVLSGGRLDFGAGVGWMESEFAALDAPSFEERGVVTDRYLGTMIELWADGESAVVGPVTMHPQPFQRPHPPIWIGGNGRPALQRAARFGDGWLPLLRQPEEIEAGRAELFSLCEAARRDATHLRVAGGYRLAWEPDGDPRTPLRGSAADIRDDVRRLEAAGCDEIHVVMADPGQRARSVLTQLERFAEDVIARVA